MPSISSQSLFSSVTTEFAVRKVQAIDPKRFNQTLFQMSDQQSRDKSYEKGLEYLRTYIASLQAKANALIEELNSIYETMLSDTLFRRADTKDTAQLLNKLPNVEQDTCSALTNSYNPKDLEITPFDENVRYYSYNPLFASRALDLQNYYNEAQNTDTSLSRAYYETSDGLHHELGASAFSTLSYLWMWDVDRINATYATTKDAFIDEAGILHVRPGDARATLEAVTAGIIIEDPLLAIAGSGDPNRLQVNVTALQPNRSVFSPDENTSVTEIDLLKVTVEEAQPLAGWITLSDFSGSQYILDTNAAGGTATQQTLNPDVTNLDPYWQNLMQWGVNEDPVTHAVHPMISNNPVSPGVAPLYNEDTSGYNSRRSFHFGNTMEVTYGGVTYAAHSNYIFEPEVVNETFDAPLTAALSPAHTKQDTWSIDAGGDTSLIGNDGPLGNNTITGDGDFPDGTLTPTGVFPATTADNYLFHDPTGLAPQDNLNLSYYWNASSVLASEDLTIRTPTFNLTDFEDIEMKVKSFYRVAPYGQKKIIDYRDNDYAFDDFDLVISEISRPSVTLNLTEAITGTVVLQTTAAATSAEQQTHYGVQIDPSPNTFFHAPAPLTNGIFTEYSNTIAKGTNNMGLVINVDELAPNDFSSLPPINPSKGVYLSAVDFRRGIEINNPNTDLIYNNNISGAPITPPYAPAVSYTGTVVADYATSTTWQIDDLYMNATGFSRGELISPEVDFTNMESGWLEFYDRIETNPFETIEKKQVWYSFDYDEIAKTGTWQLLLDKPEPENANGTWDKNVVEIPCSGDQPKVRVKFVFDTRKVVSQRSSLGGNFQRDTGYDGWNIDDIRLFGVKVDPTDFYYYRQDLDSEFVTGAGPRVASSTVPIPGLQGINTPVTQVDEDPTKLTNNVIASGTYATDKADFIIPSVISTVTTTSDVSFNVDAPDNSDALGTVSETTTMPPGNIYPAVTITGYFDDSGFDYNFDGFNEGLISFANPYLAPPLSAGEKVTIQGYTYDVIAVSGNDAYLDVAHAFRIAPPTPNVYRDLSMLSIVNSETPAVISSRAPVTLTNPRDLYWDITGVPNPQAAVLTGSLRFDSYRVNDVAYTPPAPLPPGIQENDNYAYYANINGIRVDPNINSLAKNFPIVMGFMPGIAFSSTDAPISTIDVSNINLSATASAVQITFDHSGTNASLATVRTLEILDSGGSPVSPARSYPILSDIATPVTPINLNSTEIAALQGGGKIRFTATTTDGLRVSATPDEEIWSVSSLKIKEVDSPPVESYTSEFETGLYNITQSNTKFSFDYSAVDDLSGAISDVDRKVYMYSSTDGGLTFGLPIEMLNVAVQTGNVPTFVSTGPIGMVTGTTVKFKFVTEIEVPSNVTVAPRTDLFQVKNLQMSRYDGDGYNLPEIPNAPYDSQRPNISFDARRTNLQGKYTVVNNRAQVTNADFPMFSNAFLTYIEQDASITNSKLTETYVDWVGDSENPPARVVDSITGKVKSQSDGNFIQRDDGLNQMYDTNSTGGVQDLFVDDALAINTGRLQKTTNVTDIDKNKTGWINAQDLDGPGPGNDKIWLPYMAGTKYNEGNGTYKSQTILGKRTFLTDTVNAAASLSISSNDDAYLYVNGYNVKSTAYAQTGNVISMVDASSYSNNEYVMINGNILRISSISGDDLTLAAVPPVPVLGLGNFEDSTAGQPATVYHMDLPLDAGNIAITVVGTTAPNKIELTSLNQIGIGQTITINGETYTITSTDSDLDPFTNIIDVTPANLGTNSIPPGSIVYFTTSDKGPASNPLAPGGGFINTDFMSPSVPYSVAPLLRTGFNTIGFKATEDRGLAEGISISASNITAIGDTNGPNGIDSDSRWAVKIQEKGYDGALPVSTSTFNPASNSLSQEEIVELFKSEKLEKKELTVKFINQDQNGIGKLSHIQSINVTVTGEPLIGTFKTTNYSTEQYIDGLVTTQLDKGYIRGVAQDGNGAALVFDPTDISDPDNPSSAPASLNTGLRYTTGSDGLADINVFLEKDDNIVNDATIMVRVDYYEDSNGDGLIDGDTNKNGLIDGAESGTLKTKYIGMQDLRANLPSNPKGNSAGGAIGLGPNTMVDRYRYSNSTTTALVLAGSTTLQVQAADASLFSIGDDIKIIDGVNNQTVQITNIVGNTITFVAYSGTGLGFTAGAGSTVSNNYALSDVDPNYAIRMYSGADKFNIGVDTTVHSMYLAATNGRSGGANVTGNQNKLTTRLKSILDNAEYADVIKYNLLDEIYISATASDNRGDQVVGKLILNWDWQRKRLGLTQGSFSAVYKS